MIGTDQPLLFRQKILFLHHNAKSLAPWPLICSILAAVVWLWGLTTIEREQADIRKQAYASAASQARTYAEQVERNIGQLDYILRSLQFNWQKNGGALNLEEQVYAGLVPKAARITVTIFNQTGMPVTSTISGQYKRQSVASLDYFQFHATDPSQELHFSKPSRSLMTGRDIVMLSRRLETDGGAFAGVIVLAIEPLYLGSFADETKLGPDDFISVRRSDGAFFGAKTGKGFRSQAPILKGRPAIDGPSGVRHVSADSYADGKVRIVAWHTTATYPIILLVGTTDAALQEAYQSRYREIWLSMTSASLLLLLLAAGGTWRAALRIWQSQSAREVREAYRLATENAKEGFYMLRPRYGPGNDIVDFVIEDCNERGAMYRGLPKESLVGHTASQILPILFPTHILPQCRVAMETGIFEDEMLVPERGARATQWLQRRMVRTDGGLALTLRDVTESKKQDEALVQLANADAVTSLPNRHWLMKYLPTAVDNARSTGNMLAVMFVDLDDFKNINDTLGHATGDQLLKAAALRLQAVLRPEDKIARLGGDEFTIIVEAAQTREEVVAVAERVIDTLRTPFVLNDGTRQHSVHASVGISLFPQNGTDGETLLKHADIAMYDAKERAKGTYRFFEPSLERRLVTRLTREAELKLAIEGRQLVLHYQPRVKGDTGEIVSMEALVRWIHPALGLIPPNDFIPMAEKTGLIVPLGAEVVRMACEQLAQWKAQDLPLVPVSVNVSAQQVDTGTVSAMLADALKANGLQADLLEVEVTESATVTKDGVAVSELAAIQETGIKLYVDDFGTGYSCLAQLKDLDMDGLKIDRAFTSRLGKSRTDAALFEAIVSMAHALEMRVVAEGVETVEQLAVVQALGCEEVQGYYISRPVPAAEMVLLLQKRFLFPVA
jgi:diguanylate cyclase (GGDEF)-like protein